MADDRRDAEEHVGRRRPLHDLAVHEALDPQRLRVGHLVGSDQRRAHRAERVERLAAGPLAVAELEVPGGDVVEAGVAEDVVERLGLGDPARRPPDDDGELRLEVDLCRQRRIPPDLGPGPTTELDHLEKISGADGASTPSSLVWSR